MDEQCILTVFLHEKFRTPGSLSAVVHKINPRSFSAQILPLDEPSLVCAPTFLRTIHPLAQRPLCDPSLQIFLDFFFFLLGAQAGLASHFFPASIRLFLLHLGRFQHGLFAPLFLLLDHDPD